MASKMEGLSGPTGGIVPPIPSTETVILCLHACLARARAEKPERSIMPMLSEQSFQSALSLTEVCKFSSENDGRETAESDREAQVTATNRLPPKQKDAVYSNIALAARRVLYRLVKTSNVDEPEFVDVWNLLDVFLIAGNEEHCEPGLMPTLMEELLDGHSIDGCRLLFDYLYSRKEVLASKHFQPLQTRNLVTIRTSGELLRRLSRADDAVFCGRVFVYLFRCLPLGEKGWVNYKGEFNVENVTNYQLPALENKTEDPATEDRPGPADRAPDGQTKATPSKPARFDLGDENAVRDLYPVFWAMQTVFSDPIRVTNEAAFSQLKTGLNTTLEWFRNISNVTRTDPGRVGIPDGPVGPDTRIEPDMFNLKYLTDFNLFKLELRDLKFQRNVLVQALILIDFLLSLTAEGKQKVAGLPNKSVQYSYTLSEEDAQWASETRAKIGDYLQSGPDGKFYYRMVEAVLSLDRNWVRWKLEICPPIGTDASSAADFVAARQGISEMCAVRPMRDVPLGAMDFSFLDEREKGPGGEKREGNKTLSIDQVVTKAEVADLDLDFATDEEAGRLEEQKATAMWCATRLAARANISLLGQLGGGVDVGKMRQLLAPKKRADDDDDYGHENGNGERDDGRMTDVTVLELDRCKTAEPEPVDVTMVG